jgi:hypothetical protein
MYVFREIKEPCRLRNACRWQSTNITAHYADARAVA